MLKTSIIDDSRGSSVGVRVSSIGELIVSPYGYSEGQFKELAANNTAYNFFQPKAGQQFVITAIRGKADRDVSNTVDATVIVYEAASATTTTVSKTLHQEAMIRGESFTFTGLRLLVTEGRWVNAKTDDDDIHMTILGYYIPTLA